MKYPILIIIFILGAGLIIFNLLARPELYDDSLLFQSQYVKSGQVEIIIKNSKKYNNGKSGSSYYLFTDKGRLLIDDKENFFNSTMHKKALTNIGKTCSATVDSKVFSSDWEIHHLNC